MAQRIGLRNADPAAVHAGASFFMHFVFENKNKINVELLTDLSETCAGHAAGSVSQLPQGRRIWSARRSAALPAYGAGPAL